jgi:hypothetical protein
MAGKVQRLGRYHDEERKLKRKSGVGKEFMVLLDVKS